MAILIQFEWNMANSGPTMAGQVGLSPTALPVQQEDTNEYLIWRPIEPVYTWNFEEKTKPIDRTKMLCLLNKLLLPGS